MAVHDGGAIEVLENLIEPRQLPGLDLDAL